MLSTAEQRDRAIATGRFEEFELAKVDRGDESWCLFDGSWVFSVPFEKWGDTPEPRPGDTVRYYGDGFGRPIEGVDLNGRPVYFTDEVQVAAERELSALEHRAGQIREFLTTGKAEAAATYAGLPEVFRRRIDRFVTTKGPSWWWELGAYELSCCTDAVLIAGACGSSLGIDPGIGVESDDIDGDVRHWFDEENAEQVEGTFDGHSGNSWGFAKRLAYLWLVHPDLVELEHGALTPLVGCDDYGCPHPDDVEGPHHG